MMRQIGFSCKYFSTLVTRECLSPMSPHVSVQITVLGKALWLHYRVSALVHFQIESGREGFPTLVTGIRRLSLVNLHMYFQVSWF